MSRICITVYNDPAFDEPAVASGEAYRGILGKYSDTPQGPHPM
jgi:hypothetical protein